MQRQLEPELMLEEAQAIAYAEADFEEPHSACVRLFQEVVGARLPMEAALWDLGCGPGDITLRLALANPGYRIDANS